MESLNSEPLNHMLENCTLVGWGELPSRGRYLELANHEGNRRCFQFEHETMVTKGTLPSEVLGLELFQLERTADGKWEPFMLGDEECHWRDEYGFKLKLSTAAIAGFKSMPELKEVPSPHQIWEGFQSGEEVEIKDADRVFQFLHDSTIEGISWRDGWLAMRLDTFDHQAMGLFFPTPDFQIGGSMIVTIMFGAEIIGDAVEISSSYGTTYKIPLTANTPMKVVWTPEPMKSPWSVGVPKK
ncbi:MAG: hypothetical protein JSS72_10215 [Armatimonadetes bacterium]|nr:hypothetical protein [Armatimonadota bacterium]